MEQAASWQVYSKIVLWTGSKLRIEIHRTLS